MYDFWKEYYRENLNLVVGIRAKNVGFFVTGHSIDKGGRMQPLSMLCPVDCS
jgi:hypothetical protein